MGVSFHQRRVKCSKCQRIGIAIYKYISDSSGQYETKPNPPQGWINAGGLVCSQCLGGPKVPMAKI